MRILLITFLLFFSKHSFAQGRVTTGFVISSLSSDQVEGPTMSAFNISYDYPLPIEKIGKFIPPEIGAYAGLGWNAGTMSWQSGEFNREGFVNDFRLNLSVDYSIQDYKINTGFKIPLYSKVIAGGGLSANLSSGILESSSVAKYGLSGFEIFFGGEYKVGSFNVMGIGFDAAAALSLSYSSLTMSLDQTVTDSSYDDFDGALAYDLDLSGLGFMIAFNFEIQ